MSSNSLTARVHAAGNLGATRARWQRRAAGLLARFAPRLKPPAYHRLGAFDLARSALARDVLQKEQR